MEGNLGDLIIEIEILQEIRRRITLTQRERFQMTSGRKIADNIRKEVFTRFLFQMQY